MLEYFPPQWKMEEWVYLLQALSPKMVSFVHVNVLFQILVTVVTVTVSFFTALIAMCWGTMRVTDAGPAEDLFNPIYKGCFDRIMKLHRSHITNRA